MNQYKTYKQRITYILKSAFVGFLFFLASYFLIFHTIAEGNILLATVWNLILIFLSLIGDRIEIYISMKLSMKIKEKKPNLLSRYFESYAKGATVKSGLYCFYIVLLICIALLAADPEIIYLSDMSEYFLSVRYGILVLIAVDKFMDQVFKDLKQQGEM